LNHGGVWSIITEAEQVKVNYLLYEIPGEDECTESK